MTQAFHKFWLKITALLILALAPVFTLGSLIETAGPAQFIIDFLGWPIDGSVSFAAPETRFLSALGGGFLWGWGALVWCLAAWVHDVAPEAVRRAVLAGLFAWFVPDSLGSALSGHAANAGFNLLVLILGIGPLWRPARH